VHLSFGNCSFFHNNFVDNTIQVYIFNPNYGDIYGNIWDDGYPSGGNYWSDFLTRYPSALEIDASGLWDTPYVIDSNNTDQYPIKDPIMIPEFPSVLVLPLLVMTTLLAVATHKKSVSIPQSIKLVTSNSQCLVLFEHEGRRAYDASDG
jgi:hypothetical protein